MRSRPGVVPPRSGKTLPGADSFLRQGVSAVIQVIVYESRQDTIRSGRREIAADRQRRSGDTPGDHNRKQTGVRTSRLRTALVRASSRAEGVSYNATGRSGCLYGSYQSLVLQSFFSGRVRPFICNTHSASDPFREQMVLIQRWFDDSWPSVTRKARSFGP